MEKTPQDIPLLTSATFAATLAATTRASVTTNGVRGINRLLLKLRVRLRLGLRLLQLLLPALVLVLMPTPMLMLMSTQYGSCSSSYLNLILTLLGHSLSPASPRHWEEQAAAFAAEEAR